MALSTCKQEWREASTTKKCALLVRRQILAGRNLAITIIIAIIQIVTSTWLFQTDHAL